jgi:hypothetical protein
MIDRVGESYNRLTIISFDKIVKRRNGGYNYYWNCKCSCGNNCSVEYYAIKCNDTKSCGCLRSEINIKLNTKHGYTKKNITLPEYNSWANMLRRCNNPNHKDYNYYGGRGIKICDKWLKFSGFIQDMGNKPGSDYSIDRINGNGNYCKENCRWATKLEQSNNLSSNKAIINIITGEEYKSISSLARFLNISVMILKYHLKRKKSKKVELPVIYLVTTKEDFDQLPKGLPYIIGNELELPFIRTFLEFQVIYRSCLKTGLSIKWLDCLSRLGYKSNLKQYRLSSGGEFTGGNAESSAEIPIDRFIEDQYLVNFDRLTELKVLPTWLDDLRASIETNIIDEVIFDPCAFNKQLGVNVGAAAMKHNKKNLLILDVSGSMPDGVVKTLTNLAKLMSKKFFADLIITGGQTYFVPYEKVQDESIVDLAKKAGRNNEGVMYRAIVKEHRDYGTIISFGDGDNPGSFDKSTNEEICNFKCETLYNLHTSNDSEITGYSRWMKPTLKTEMVKGWISTINQ